MNPAEHTRLAWRKSSYSATNNGCVEVAWRGPAAQIRDSKAPARGVLAVEQPGWRVFLAAVQ